MCGHPVLCSGLDGGPPAGVGFVHLRQDSHVLRWGPVGCQPHCVVGDRCLGPLTFNTTSQVLQHIEGGMGVKCQARLRPTRLSDRAEVFTCHTKTYMQRSLQISQTHLLWNSYLSCSVTFQTSEHGMSPCSKSNALAAHEAAQSLHIHRL